jgi:hypothetical protein
MTCTGGGTCVNTGTDCPGNFLLCDGFESDSIDTTTKWESPNCTSLTAMSVGAVAHTGKYALHVAMQTVSNTAYVACTLKTQQASIFSSTPMYFRAWIYFQSFIPGTNNTLILITPSSANGQSASGGLGINAVGSFIAGQSNSGSDYEKTSTTQAIFPNTWTCIELGINTDYGTYPNGLLQAYDTTSGTPDMTGNANLQSLVSAEFGLEYNGPATQTDLYIDDIAISNTYIGCSQ